MRAQAFVSEGPRVQKMQDLSILQAGDGKKEICPRPKRAAASKSRQCRAR